MKKLVLILMIILLFFVVFIKIENDIIYYSVFALLTLLSLVYYYITDYISIKAISKELKSEDFFVIKAGVAKTDPRGVNLIKGALVIYSSMVLFYVRKSSFGGVKVYDSFALDQLEEYTIDNPECMYKGISFKLTNGSVKNFAGKTIKEKENELRIAMGYDN